MRVFITGGAGFIGCNVARHHLERGDEIVVFDNLSRRGAQINLEWLHEISAGRLRFVQGDVRSAEALAKALPADAERVYHLAGQVAAVVGVRGRGVVLGQVLAQLGIEGVAELPGERADDGAAGMGVRGPDHDRRAHDARLVGDHLARGLDH